jgi:hypothetical protein
MKLVQQRYTQYFNKKYGAVGHVFQGRYKAFLVNKDNYLKQLILYIHHNPLAEYLNTYPEAISKVYQKVLRNEYPDLKLEESVREIIKKLTNV